MSEVPESRFLSDSQRRVVGYALTMLGLLGIGALTVFAFIGLGRMASYFSGVLWPLAVAGVLALILRPIVEIGENKLGLRRLFSVILLYGLFLIFTASFLVLLVPPLLDQLLDFVAYAPTLWHNITAYTSRVYPEWIAIVHRQLENPMIRQLVDSLNEELNGLLLLTLPSLKAAGGGVMSVIGFITHLAIVPIYLFFFLLSRGEPTRELGGHLTFLSRSVREDVVFLIDEFITIIVSFFRGQLLIGLIMGSLMALGFTFVGLKFGLFIGLVLGVLNIIPYLGTMIGLAITLPLAFFQPEGGLQLIGMVLLVYIVVQNIEGWYLTPKIMGDRTGLNPLTIVVAIFFWGTAFDGLLGMLFAIPLTAFFVTLWRLLRRKYFEHEST